MDTQQAYDTWAAQYDTNENKTRDLEARSLRETVANIDFHHCLEIGCGTGKNTEWLVDKAKQITAVDLSNEMLAKAQSKINAPYVEFKQFNITTNWTFGREMYDLVSFSLVLEHINDLDHIFKEASASLKSNGHVYIGELHPFKQYTGSKARFETSEGMQVVECFNHHISDFVLPAKKYGLHLEHMNEYFDNDDRNEIPRILALLFKKTRTG
jgi:ubiquinone/menaquinone biosynthesis C-methylase UbiE